MDTYYGLANVSNKENVYYKYRQVQLPTTKQNVDHKNAWLITSCDHQIYTTQKKSSNYTTLNAWYLQLHIRTHGPFTWFSPLQNFTLLARDQPCFKAILEMIHGSWVLSIRVSLTFNFIGPPVMYCASDLSIKIIIMDLVLANHFVASNISFTYK